MYMRCRIFPPSLYAAAQTVHTRRVATLICYGMHGPIGADFLHERGGPARTVRPSECGALRHVTYGRVRELHLTPQVFEHLGYQR